MREVIRYNTEQERCGKVNKVLAAVTSAPRHLQLRELRGGIRASRQVKETEEVTYHLEKWKTTQTPPPENP